jgi:alkylated DNA repair dioxygenase AlkB
MSVPGLYYFPNIISSDDSKQMITFLDSNSLWKPITNHPNSRVVQQFGYLYNYKNGNTNQPTIPIPNEFNILVENGMKICNELGLISDDYKFNQCIVNKYICGQGISAHKDSELFGPVIICYTLESGASMTFRLKDEKKTIYVEPNSLYIMSDEARYLWTHEMTSVKSDKVNGKKLDRDTRISITFRNVK